MEKTRDLVIGSDGFVGRSLCAFLEAKSHRVVRFDLKRSPQEDARAARLDLEAVDRVFFLAWEVGGAKFLYREDFQFAQLDSNLRLMLNLFPQLREARKPFLFVSSQLAEECDTVYGVTKRLGEVWSHLLEGVRVRLWNVYGGYEPQSERSHVVADFVWQALQHGVIRMLTTGEERRQFIYVDDVCRGLDAALRDGLQEPCDLTSFEWVPVIRVARIIADLTGAKVVPGDRQGSTPITPIRGRIPGWLPTVPLAEGLERTVADYRRRLEPPAPAARAAEGGR